MCIPVYKDGRGEEELRKEAEDWKVGGLTSHVRYARSQGGKRKRFTDKKVLSPADGTDGVSN